MSGESLCFFPVVLLLGPPCYYIFKEIRAFVHSYCYQIKTASVSSLTLTNRVPTTFGSNYNGPNPILQFNLFPNNNNNNNAGVTTNNNNNNHNTGISSTVDENEPLFGGDTITNSHNSDNNGNLSIQTGSHPRATSNLNKNKDIIILNDANNTVNSVNSVKTGQIGKNMSLASSLNVLLYFTNIKLWYFCIFGNYLFQRLIFIHMLSFRHNSKYIIMDLQDCWELLLRSTIIYVFGNISDRVYNPLRRKYFYYFYFYFSVMYSIAFEICPEGVQISTQMDSSFGVLFLLIFGPILILYTLFSNCNTVYKLKNTTQSSSGPLLSSFSGNISAQRLFNSVLRYLYFGGSIMIAIYHFLVFNATKIDSYLLGAGLSNVNENINYSIHIHHHHWAFMLCLLFRGNSDATFIAHALVLAIFVHGIIYFGLEPIYRIEDSL